MMKWLWLGVLLLMTAPVAAQNLPDGVIAVEPVAYVAHEQAAVLACTRLDCRIQARLRIDEAVMVLGRAMGEVVEGSGVWLWVEYNRLFFDRHGFVHSSAITRADKITPTIPVRPDESPTPTQAPAPALVVTPARNSRRPANCDQARAWGLSEREAARWSHLDRDKDGVACYGD